MVSPRLGPGRCVPQVCREQTGVSAVSLPERAWRAGVLGAGVPSGVGPPVPSCHARFTSAFHSRSLLGLLAFVMFLRRKRAWGRARPSAAQPPVSWVSLRVFLLQVPVPRDPSTTLRTCRIFSLLSRVVSLSPEVSMAPPFGSSWAVQLSEPQGPPAMGSAMGSVS